MTKIAFLCAWCGQRGQRETGDYNRKVRQGVALCCSRDCFYHARAAHGEAIRKERERPCETCGKAFAPRLTQLASGGGRYCSQRCNVAVRAAGLTPEVIARRAETRRRLEAEGKVKRYRGEENPRWNGGVLGRRQRDAESGRATERCRRYRKNNPDKVREFNRRRKAKTMGALPHGTLQQIRSMQKNKCAICRTSLKHGDHVDHIMPLARGGEHKPKNLQLLCPPCNLRKSAKDPIEHMQSLGRLL